MARNRKFESVFLQRVSPQTFGPSRVATNARSLVPAAHSRVPTADQPDLAGYDIHIDRHGRKALKVPASELFFRDEKLQLLARRDEAILYGRGRTAWDWSSGALGSFRIHPHLQRPVDLFERRALLN